MAFKQSFDLAEEKIGDLSKKLKVSRQAVSLWFVNKNVPLLRALQIEKMTGGEVLWQDLCPGAAKVLKSTPTL